MTIELDDRLLKTGEAQAFAFQEIPDCSEYPLDGELKVPLEVKGYCRKEDDVCLVEGSVEGRLAVRCSRCLAEMEYPIHLSFYEEFLVDGPEEGEAYTCTSHALSLDKMVLDLIAMNLPVRFLCREDCKGLCPVCGADRNVQSCSCVQEKPKDANPFDKLKGLFD